MTQNRQKQNKQKNKTPSARQTPKNPVEKAKNLLTVNIIATVIIVICASWIYYCTYVSDKDFFDHSVKSALLLGLLYMVTMCVSVVGWILVALLALVSIIMCIADSKQKKHSLQVGLIIKHLLLVILTLIPCIMYAPIS